MEFICKHCVPFTSYNSLQRLSKHLSRIHRDVSMFKCGQSYCRNEYEHLTSLVRHIEHSHGAVDSENVCSGQSSAVPSARASPVIFNADILADHEDEVMDVDELIEEEDADIDLKQTAISIVLDLRSSGSLTDVAIEKFQNGCLKMVNDVCLLLKKKIRSFLRKKNLADEDAEKLLEECKVADPFTGIKTVEQQLEYFSNHFGLVKPEQKFLKYRIDNRLKGTTFLPTQVPDTFQYVSVKETLTTVVQNDFLRSLILSEKDSTDGSRRTYRDGRYFKNNRFLQKYPYALRLNLYYDDLEVANPLSSKTVIHKLGAFYFNIQNLPPELNSKLSSIHLLNIAYAEDLKSETNLIKALTPFFIDLSQLESDEGVEVELKNGETFILRATMVSLCADTLAAHELLGLISPSARHFCRVCLVSRPDFHANPNVISRPRTKENLSEHAEMVKRNKDFQKQCGVRFKSPLLEAKYFDPSRDAFFDIFHDVFLGVCQVDLCLVLKEYTYYQSLFTVEDFNALIYAFNYGVPDRRNKPSANFTEAMLCSSSGRLKQTGSQVWCLLRVFPFLIGTKIPENDRHMELIFIMQDIVKILFALCVTQQDIDRLDSLVSEHNALFHELFVVIAPCVHEQLIGSEDENISDEDNSGEEDDPGDPDDFELAVDENTNEENNGTRQRRRRVRKKLKGMKNKAHHMTHYKHMIEGAGPMVLLWCARFEARHAILRRHTAICCNFKNGPRTAAQVIQLSNCSELLKVNSLSPNVETGIMTSQVANQYRFSQVLLTSGFCTQDEIIRTCEKAIINSTEYRIGLFVSLPKPPTSRQPIFGCICDIVLKSACEVYFVVRKWRNEGTDCRFNAYKMIEDREIILTSLKMLSNHRPLALWHPENDPCVYLSPRTIDV